jgi:hypothetical protein
LLSFAAPSERDTYRQAESAKQSTVHSGPVHSRDPSSASIVAVSCRRRNRLITNVRGALLDLSADVPGLSKIELDLNLAALIAFASRYTIWRTIGTFGAKAPEA